MKNSMNYFTDIELFSDLSLKDQEDLSAFCQIQNLNAWDILFNQWDEPQAMYVISSGKLLVQKKSDQWEVQNIAMLGEWDVVWEIAFFWDPPTRNATVIVHEKSSVIVIIKFGIEQMMDKYPDLYENVRAIIEERI